MTSVKNKRRLLVISTVLLIALLVSSMAIIFWPINKPSRLITYSFGNTDFQMPPSTTVATINNSIIFNTPNTAYAFNTKDQYSTVTKEDGNILANEQVNLEVNIDGEWRSAGKLVSTEHSKVADIIHQVTRTYESSYATWQTIYDIQDGGNIKLTVNVEAKISATYRIVWTLDVPLRWQGVQNGDSMISDDFYFDWSDVTTTFGDITTHTINTIENAKRHVLTFNIGALRAGEKLSLDPTFGNDQRVNMFVVAAQSDLHQPYTNIFGSVFTLPVNGYILSGTTFINSIVYRSGGQFVPHHVDVAIAIYSYPSLTFVAATPLKEYYVETPLASTTECTINFNSLINLPAGQYVIATWASIPKPATTYSDINTRRTYVFNSAGGGSQAVSTTTPPNWSDFSLSVPLFSIVMVANYVTYETTPPPPSYSNVSWDNSVAGKQVNFKITWSDFISLNSYIFSSNITGAWQNNTAVNFSSNPQTIITAKTLPSNLGVTISFCWYANNQDDAWTATDIYSLTITSEYVPPTLYSYTVTGPFLENGQVFKGRVSGSVNYPYQPSFAFTLDGTDNAADTILVPSNNFAINVAWNITSDGNIQRSFNFNPQEANVTVKVTVPDSNNPFQTTSMYRVYVVAFAGLSNSFVQILRNIDGVNTIIESKPLDVLNAIPFYLINNQQYTLRIISDQGSWTFNFPTDGVLEKTFVITKDMVPVQDPTSQVAINFERATEAITVSVTDTLDDSSIIVTDIRVFNGQEWSVVYIQTDVGNQGVFWQDANPNENYLITTTVYRQNKEPLVWQRSLPASKSEMQFTGYFEVLGNWPFPANQLLGLFIVGAFVTLLSWRDMEAACLIGCVVAGICVLLGLLDVSVTAIAMGFFIVVALYIHQGKKGEFNAV